MPGNNFAYDKSGKKIYVNTRVRYRRGTAIVTDIIDSEHIKIKTGAIITAIASRQSEVS